MPKARRTKRKTVGLDAPLAHLESAHLVRHITEGEDAYSFKHALIQDTAYESLLKHDRMRLHRAVAAAIERAEPDRLDENAARLAQHYAVAGDNARTLEYLVRAGDTAARVQANTQAIEYYTKAIDLAPRLEVTSEKYVHLYMRRGRSLELTGDYDRALENYEAMASMGRKTGDRPLELEALMAAATIHSTPTARFDAARAQELAEQTLAIARELKDRAAEAKVLWNQMLLNYFRGNHTLSEHFGKQSLTLARAYDLREQLAYTLNDMGRLYQALGRLPEAISALEEAKGIWIELDNKPMLVDNLVASEFQFLGTGDYDKVLQMSDEAYQMSETIGSMWGQAYSRMSTGRIFWDRGQIDIAIQRMEECIRLADKAGFLVGATGERAELGRLYALMGDLDAGLTLAREAFERGQTLTGTQPLIAAYSAQFDLLAGNLVKAEADLEQISRLENESSLAYSKSFHLLAEGELALAKNDNSRALRAVGELKNDNNPLSRMLFDIEAQWLEARALRASGDNVLALATLTKVNTLATKLGMRRLRWEILAMMADIEKERGDEARALELHAQAREIVQYIADHTPARLREFFLNLPKVRQVLKDEGHPQAHPV